MAGAMRKMAVYLGLVEDDGYDGRGFDPDDEFEPELDPEPERTGGGTSRHQAPGAPSQRDEPVRVGTSRPRDRSRTRPLAAEPATAGSPPWHPSHLNVRTWRRTHR